MKFYGEPNLMVRDSSNNKIYYFDKNGELNTDDDKLIKKLKIYFKYKKQGRGKGEQ